MDKPRIFLGSTLKQEKLLTRGLEDIAHVNPWMTSFNPGTTTFERLGELAHEVDFAAFVFAHKQGIYLRADPEDMSILDGPDDQRRAELIAERLRNWKSITNV